MFDIDYLLIKPLEEHLYSLKNIEYQVLFLFQIIDFETISVNTAVKSVM